MQMQSSSRELTPVPFSHGTLHCDLRYVLSVFNSNEITPFQPTSSGYLTAHSLLRQLFTSDAEQIVNRFGKVYWHLSGLSQFCRYRLRPLQKPRTRLVIPLFKHLKTQNHNMSASDWRSLRYYSIPILICPSLGRID